MTYTNNAHSGTTAANGDQGVRLQKALAAAGVASRRASEDLIRERRVRVNGKVVEEMGRRIHLDRDKISVDGKAVQLDVGKRYVMLNKPAGVVSSLHDEVGRPDLREFTDQYPERLFNVGRLDYETSGLLLLTNDGEVAHVLAHPSFGAQKTYVALVRGIVTGATLKQLRTGIELEDGPIAVDRIRAMERSPGIDSTLLEITLHSGRNRIVRRMLEAVGHPVRDLVRRQFGPLHLGTLRAAATRDLTPDEVSELLTMARKASKTESGNRGTAKR